MFYWTRVLLHLQVGIGAVLALLLSLALLVGSMFGAGRQIAFESFRDRNWEIYLMDIDRYVDYNLTRSPDKEIAPAWSSDGRFLLFLSGQDTKLGTKLDGNIYIMDVSNGETRYLTTTDESNTMPAWSPDGQSIVYVNQSSMIVMDIDGSHKRGLIHGFSPAWSPDSRRIMYNGKQDEYGVMHDIFDIDIETLTIRNLTEHEFGDCCASWSPDGNWIVFFSNRSGNGDIYVMPNCDGNFSPCSEAAYAITHTPFSDNAPSWSPDSQQIAFTSSSDGYDNQIFIVDLDGNNLHQLTSGLANRTPAWRPG